jgi:hypothetical protein
MSDTIMSFEEKMKIVMKSIELKHEGKTEEASLLMRQELPMTPYLAQIAKDVLGADFLIRNGYNLSEAEAEYGQDWLYR